MHARRYAEGTTVSEDRSRAELERLLRAHGATNVITGSVDEPTAAALAQFRLEGRFIRWHREYPEDQCWRTTRRLAERRRIWRVAVLWAKARLEVIASGDSTAAVEFLPWVALPDGGTVGAWLEPQIAELYAAGTMPARLLLSDAPAGQ